MIYPTPFAYTEIRNTPTSAWFGHGPFALWLTEQMRPETIVELGSFHGFSFFAFCQAVRELKLAAKVHAVDTWQGDEHAGFYENSVFTDVQAITSTQFADIGVLHRCKFDEALEHFEDACIDILHIDGLHTYEAVSHDFATWSSRVRPGGLVLFHDTAQRRDGFGVYKLWARLKENYPSFEFYHCNGLGVLGVEGAFPAPIQSLFDLSPESSEASDVRERFEQLGAKYELIAARRELDRLTKSKSWRITKPLRDVDAGLRRFFR